MQEQTINTGFLKAAQAFAVGAIILAIPTELLQLAFACFSGCSDPSWFTGEQVTSAARILIPYLIVEAVALWMFWMYCLEAKQIQRGVRASIIIALSALVGVVVISGYTFYQYQQSQSSQFSGPSIDWTPIQMMASTWSQMVAVVVVAWSLIIARLIWPTGAAPVSSDTHAPDPTTEEPPSAS